MDMALTTVRKIGNSHGILLPAELLLELGLKNGEQVEVVRDADRLIVRAPQANHRAAFIHAMESILDEDAAILGELAK